MLLTITMDAIAYSLLLVAICAWLIRDALREALLHWNFIRRVPEPAGHDDPHSPFRASEPASTPMWFDDRGERRALTIARMAGCALVVFVVGVTRWAVDDLPGDARWILVAWSFVIAGTMLRDQVCREWWGVLVGLPGLLFAMLIDTALAAWSLGIWLTHVGLRVWVELRNPLWPRRSDAHANHSVERDD